MWLWQWVRSIVALLSQPWQHSSPKAVVCRAATAWASASLKSKSPPTHSWLGQSRRHTDLAWSGLTVYLIWLFRLMPSGLRYPYSTVKDFNSRNFSDRVADAWVRWFSC